MTGEFIYQLGAYQVSLQFAQPAAAETAPGEPGEITQSKNPIIINVHPVSSQVVQRKDKHAM